MGRVKRVRVDPRNPQSIVDQMDELMRTLEEQIEIGDPQNPSLDTSAALAGTTHNGRILNIRGSWVEVQLDDAVNLLNTNVTCTHNLGLQVLSAAQPNVRWLVFGWQHSGVGAGAGTAVSAGYIDGTVATNSIQLRFYANTLTVTAANPLRVCLFFTPAVRGIAQP